MIMKRDFPSKTIEGEFEVPNAIYIALSAPIRPKTPVEYRLNSFNQINV